jgi:hypothetical protein
MKEGDIILTPMPQAGGKVIGSIGSILPERHRRLLHWLSEYLFKTT